jgi:hypothetical protein
MKKRFAIFWFDGGGLQCIEEVETLETAKARVEEIPEPNSRRYAVLDQRTGNRLSFAPKERNQVMGSVQRI